MIHKVYKNFPKSLGIGVWDRAVSDKMPSVHETPKISHLGVHYLEHSFNIQVEAFTSANFSELWRASISCFSIHKLSMKVCVVVNRISAILFSTSLPNRDNVVQPI